MAILARLLRLLLWVIVVLIGATWLGKKLAAWMFGSAGNAPGPAGGSGEAKLLHRDPCCGTYVSSQISFPLTEAGQTHHFCSVECRERYRKSQAGAASA